MKFTCPDKPHAPKPPIAVWFQFEALRSELEEWMKEQGDTRKVFGQPRLLDKKL